MPTRVKSRGASLYDADFVGWTEDQTRALRGRQFAALDLEQLAEEIEGLGKRDRRKPKSCLTVLIMHLLKWRDRPDQRSGSWESTIRNQRAEIRQLLDDSPSLVASVPAFVAEVRCWRRNAAAETGLALVVLPADCPFATDAILTDEWLP